MICLKIRTFVVSATTGIRIILTLFPLWFAWKFVPLWYQQQQVLPSDMHPFSCDLLENSYLCGISNNGWVYISINRCVVICLKIRTFVVSATTCSVCIVVLIKLWFAWKFVPLWYQQQHCNRCNGKRKVVICLKIRTFVVSATTVEYISVSIDVLWFAWKFVPLWYQQQRHHPGSKMN